MDSNSSRDALSTAAYPCNSFAIEPDTEDLCILAGPDSVRRCHYE